MSRTGQGECGQFQYPKLLLYNPLRDSLETKICFGYWDEQCSVILSILNFQAAGSGLPFKWKKSTKQGSLVWCQHHPQVPKGSLPEGGKALCLVPLKQTWLKTSESIAGGGGASTLQPKEQKDTKETGTLWQGWLFGKSWSQPHTLHDLLKFHLQGLNSTARMVTSGTLDSMDGEAAIHDSCHIIVF